MVAGVTDSWISIVGWDKFQHYKDRDPVWIKVYTELNSRDDWLDLTDAERGLLTLLWVEFARSNGRLRISNVPARDRQKSRKRAYERLNEAGFIRLSASPPARARAREKREETDSPKSSHQKKPPKGTTGWRIVRGSHGTTHVPDPFGTDRPPADAPLLKEIR